MLLLTAITPVSGSAAIRYASEAIGIIHADSAGVQRNGKFVAVDMTLDLSGLQVRRNRAIDITPALVSDTDTLLLDPIGIYGSSRYIQLQRVGSREPIDPELLFKSGDRQLLKPVAYTAVAPYTPGMDGSELMLIVSSFGCCSQPSDTATMGPIATLMAKKKFELGTPMWKLPEASQLINRKKNTKTRNLSGSAYIDFPVNKTEIRPDYHNNEYEIAKIRATIDTIIGDPDIEVNSISIKGYASPEGRYSANAILAEGRTRALSNYVRDTYGLPAQLFITSSEAENWEGLRQALDTLRISHREEILAIIDSDREPDRKEAEMRERYRDSYNFLLTNIYPLLRRSDYRIDYTIKDYETPNVIEAVMSKDAGRLSAEEFFIAASSHEPGSPEFIAINALILQYYPDNTIANYNMAVAALQQGDADAAAARLAKAGDGDHVEWAKGKLRELQDSKLND